MKRSRAVAPLLAGLLLLGVAAGCGTPSPAARAEVAPPPMTPRAAAAAQPAGQPPEVLPARTAEERVLLRVVSKQAPLGASYVPDELIPLPPDAASPGLGTLQLTRPVAGALLAMQAAARAASLEVRVQSAYRAFEQQQQVHAALAARVGEPEASRRSALPGYSEHQLGTTVDLTSASVGWGLNARFAAAAEGQWLAAHAHEFGFALSYPEGAEAVTGYIYEPWHFRYIGPERAAAWRASGLVLIEYLGRVVAAAAQ